MSLNESKPGLFQQLPAQSFQVRLGPPSQPSGEAESETIIALQDKKRTRRFDDCVRSSQPSEYREPRINRDGGSGP